MNEEKKDPRNPDLMRKEFVAGQKEKAMLEFFSKLSRKSRRAIRRAQARLEGRPEGMAAMMERLRHD